MTDNVIIFPSTVKASSQTKQVFSLEDMLECLAAMNDMLLDPSHKVEGIAISLVAREGDGQTSYSAYCSNNVSSQLGGLLMLQKRIMEESV